MKLLLAVVFLALATPLASAGGSGGLSLDVDGSTNPTAQDPDGPVVYAAVYSMTVEQSMTITMATRVDRQGSAGAQDHEATWRIDGSLRGTSTRTTSISGESRALRPPRMW